MTEERVYRVDVMTRVEGEGRFVLRVGPDGSVREAKLSIFEAPRYFEALLRGRDYHEVPDIVARICGICPVAYQVSSMNALEQALRVQVEDSLRKLRRLLYCGEWIESHALHVFLLHAPDFLGYPSALEMARDHRAVVDRGLKIKKVGNQLISVLGGRATHPVSPRVGGFSKVPTKEALQALLPALEEALEETKVATRWAATLPMPQFTQDYLFVSLGGTAEYPLERGDRVLLGRAGETSTREIAIDRWSEVFVESQVEHSNALQCRLHDGTPYLCGPQARLHHHAEKLHPTAKQLMEEIGQERTERNPYRSLLVRLLEVAHALAEAVDLIRGYEVPKQAMHSVVLQAGKGAGASEAPRGLLWHEYEVRADGTIESAKIVPPTSQNQARMEDDLRAMAPELLALPQGQATHRCEQLLRSYDPCISCATHFLKLEIAREQT